MRQRICSVPDKCAHIREPFQGSSRNAESVSPGEWEFHYRFRRFLALKPHHRALRATPLLFSQLGGHDSVETNGFVDSTSDQTWKRGGPPSYPIPWGTRTEASFPEVSGET